MDIKFARWHKLSAQLEYVSAPNESSNFTTASENTWVATLNVYLFLLFGIFYGVSQETVA